MENAENWTDTVHKYSDLLIAYLMKYGLQVLGGIIILIVGIIVANWVSRLFVELCHKRKLDVTLTKFLAMIVKAVVLVFVGMIALEKFGVTISPFIAAASALIFGASFAIQAPLSNYAAGLSIILTRPFVVGNTISVKGVSGLVEEVKLPCTVLSTGDGEKITVPNKDIVGEVIVNSFENKVVEREVGISYHDDPKAAIEIIHKTLAQTPKVMQTPPPQVGIDSFGDSSINIGMRYWVPTRNYYETLYSANLAVYQALQNAKISIPFPQREVRMLSN